MGPIKALSTALASLVALFTKSCTTLEKVVDTADHLVTAAERNCYAIRVEEEAEVEKKLQELRELNLLPSPAQSDT